jgi:hypothetical protein
MGLADRYLAFVGPPDSNGCRPWLGTRLGSHPLRQYGRIQIAGVRYLAHRLGWELTYGPIPLGLDVCHTCDHPWCCEPTHWFLGTRGDNNRDRSAKGRSARMYGTTNGRAKLTPSQVRNIRAASGSHRALAAHYGVTETAIRYVRAGRTWI